MTSAAVAAAGRISARPAAAALAWHGHRRNAPDAPGVGKWPELGGALGDDAGMFYFLVLLSGVPHVRRLHAAHAIPRDVVVETMSDVGLNMGRYRAKRGVFGLSPQFAGGWLRNHFRGALYRLGRLQFIPRAFGGGVTAFRGRDGAVLALAQDGIVFRADGQRNGASGVTDTRGIWTSALTRSHRAVCGHPIDPAAGAARREPVTLALDRWQPVLAPGDPALEIHIPAGDPLTPAACADSVRRAAAFFPRHFPDRPAPRAVVSNTWLLDPQLTAYLPPTSNIVRFLRAFYLYPVDCDAWSAVRFVFGLDIEFGSAGPVDLSALRPRTTLERALLAHIAAGKRWRRAGGFVLVDDLPWGRRAYGDGGAPACTQARDTPGES
jgi:hypothetical protein